MTGKDYGLQVRGENLIFVSVRHYIHRMIEELKPFTSLYMEAFENDVKNGVFVNQNATIEEKDRIRQTRESVIRILDKAQDYNEQCTSRLNAKLSKGRPHRMITTTKQYVYVAQTEFLRALQSERVFTKRVSQFGEGKVSEYFMLLGNTIKKILDFPNIEDFIDDSQNKRQTRLDGMNVPPTYSQLMGACDGHPRNLVDIFTDYKPSIEKRIYNDRTEERYNEFTNDSDAIQKYVEVVCNDIHDYFLGATMTYVGNAISEAIDPEKSEDYEGFLQVCNTTIPQKVASYDGRSGLMKKSRAVVIETIQKVYGIDVKD